MTQMKNIITFFIAFLIFKSDLLADINKLNFGFLSITILVLIGILMIKKVDVPKSY